MFVMTSCLFVGVQSSQDVVVQIKSGALCGPEQKQERKSIDPVLEVKTFTISFLPTTISWHLQEM